MKKGDSGEAKRTIAILLLLFAVLVTTLFLLKTLPVSKLPEPVKKKETVQPKVPRTLAERAQKIFPKQKNLLSTGDIAIIIDDVGWNRGLLSQLSSVQFPLTLAVLPNTPYGEEIARKAHHSPKHQVILHIPLEPLDAKKIGKEDFLRLSMDEKEIRIKMDGYLKKLEPYIVGVNNHMGSAFTVSEEKMQVLLQELKKRDLFFVDSLTNSASCAYTKAKQIGIPFTSRDIFLDNVNDAEEIRENIEKMKKIAAKEGSVVAIGHDRPLTIQALKKYLPQLAEEGYRINFVSHLVQ
ncbi:MAG: divergent polysaccharide deacetylase family protein [Candidatus Ratteibacteria bacterium]